MGSSGHRDVMTQKCGRNQGVVLYISSSLNVYVVGLTPVTLPSSKGPLLSGEWVATGIFDIDIVCA